MQLTKDNILTVVALVTGKDEDTLIEQAVLHRWGPAFNDILAQLVDNDPPATEAKKVPRPIQRSGRRPIGELSRAELNRGHAIFAAVPLGSVWRDRYRPNSEATVIAKSNDGITITMKSHRVGRESPSKAMRFTAAGFKGPWVRVDGPKNALVP